MVLVGMEGQRALIGGVAVALLAASGGGCAASGDDENESMAPVSVAPMAGTSGAAGVTAGTGMMPSSGGNTGTDTGSAGMNSAAGASGTTGSAGMESGVSGQSGAAGTAGMSSPPPSGDGPTLPEVEGECPQFVDGSTIMVAGHGGILITAGPPGMGGPLLFYWHGTNQSPEEAMGLLPESVRSDIVSSGGIIAAFDGRASSGAAGDCSGTAAHNIADFEAADQIAACAVRDHGIDPRRIYTTGCSAGGLQSGCMAQLRSSYIAAAAPNSGGVTRPQMWQDEHAPAIFTMHGGPDDWVIVAFADTSRALDMNAKSHGSFVVNCDHGGGHCRAPADLQSAAWEFLKDHPWGTTQSPWTDGIPSGVPSYCMPF
jgi:hypothetical protein